MHVKIVNVNAPFKKQKFTLSGLCYKPMMIVNDDSRVVNKLETSLTDDAIVIIYDCHMFIVQATEPGAYSIKLLGW